MKDRIRFRCPNCNRKIKAKRKYAAILCDCPACEKPVRVPSSYESIPLQHPDDTISISLSKGQRILDATLWNCTIAARYGNKDEFRKHKKEGKRSLTAIHMQLYARATEAKPNRSSINAIRLANAASPNKIGTDKKRRRRYRNWLKTQSMKKASTELFRLHEPALADIIDMRERVTDLRFRVIVKAQHNESTN